MNRGRDELESRQPIWVIGAGGQGKVVVATLLAEGRIVAGVLDDDESRWGEKILGVEVVGAEVVGAEERPSMDGGATDDNSFDGQAADDRVLRAGQCGTRGLEIRGPGGCSRCPELAPVILGIGSGRVRRAAARRLEGVVRWANAIHPMSMLDPSVRIGEGTVIFAGAILQPDAMVGRHVIVNTSASVDHDNELGDFCFIGPGSTLAGDVILEEGAFLGVGSSVLPGRRVGAWATVGAGAVVAQDVEPGATVVGVPARAR